MGSRDVARMRGHESFQKGVDSLAGSYCCEDAGDSGHDGRKWARYYAGLVAEDLNVSLETVYREIRSAARSEYLESC